MLPPEPNAYANINYKNNLFSNEKTTFSDANNVFSNEKTTFSGANNAFSDENLFTNDFTVKQSADDVDIEERYSSAIDAFQTVDLHPAPTRPFRPPRPSRPTK